MAVQILWLQNALVGMLWFDAYRSGENEQRVKSALSNFKSFHVKTLRKVLIT